MTIIRTIHNRENPYAQLSKKIINDENLSFKALGLWTWAMSKPNNWHFHIDQICKVRREGRAAITSAIDELIANGYCFRYQNKQRDPSGKFIFGSVEYLFFEYKLSLEEIEEFKKSFPHCGFLQAENLRAENQQLQNTESFIDNSYISKEQQQQKEPVAVVSCLKDKKLALSDENQQAIMQYAFSEDRLIAACEFVKHPAYDVNKSIIATIIWHCKQQNPPSHTGVAPKKENAAKSLEIDPEIIEMRRARFKQMRLQKWNTIKSKDLYCENIGDLIHIGESKLSLLDNNFDHLYLKLLKHYNLGEK